MLAVPGRRVDRLLQVHAAMDMAQEHLGDPLVLLVAARRAPAHVRLAVAMGEGRRQRGARPLARRQRAPAGLPRARTSGRACRAGSRARASTGEPCSQPPDGVAETMLPSLSTMSKCTVSPLIWPMRPTVGSPAPLAATRGARRRRPAQLHHAAIAVDLARPLLERRAGRIDQLAPVGVVGVRQQGLHRHVDELRDRRRRPRGRRRRACSPRPRVWMKSALVGSTPSRLKPLSSASCCRVTGPCAHGPALQTV